MDQNEWLADRFEEHRAHLRAVAYRMLGRTPAAARQLASRARRRVKGAEVPAPDPDLARQRQVVDAFFRAARGGDFDALVAVLDPDVVARIDAGAWRPAASMMIRGA